MDKPAPSLASTSGHSVQFANRQCHSTEQALLESEIRFKTLIESMQEGVIIVNDDDRIQYVNQHFCKMLGYEARELIGYISYSTLFKHANLITIRQKNHLHLQGVTDQYDVQITHKSGQQIWVHISGVSILDAEGVVSSFYGIISDINERKVSEQHLLKNEERYRLLFNSGNDAVFVFQASGNRMESLVEVNDNACRKLGYTRSALMQLPPESLLTDLKKPEFRDRLHKLFDERQILFETHLQTHKGRQLPVEISAHLFELNDHPAVMAIARDIATRKRAETQLREQAALLEKAQDAIMVFDLNKLITYWNKSATRLYGWESTEVLGNDGFSLLFQGNAKRYEDARRSVIDSGEWQGEMYQITKSGHEIIVQSRWTLVKQNKSPKSILVVNTDITERKQIEAQFLRAQRMESIGSLAGGVAHDLNNVLAPILTAVQVLQARFSKDERSQRILNTIESNVKRGADMIKQILSFARGVEGEREPLHLQRVIGEIEEIVREAFPKSIQMRTVLPTDLWVVSGDSTQLHQVLLNLCVNSRDAMPDGGELIIHAQNVFLDMDAARKQLEAYPGEFVHITVRDTGVGIPDSAINKIFEPFFTTKEHGKGTGLGLSTAMAIVKSHEGFINVQSDKGQGTTFDIYLPALTHEALDKENEVITAPPQGKGECVLVIDDEPFILEIAQMTLENNGYKVLGANDGAEALGIYARHKDQISLVLTDMMMPVMDGIETIMALRKINPSLKIIASSGFVEDPRVKQFIETGTEAFLQKPYTGDKLLLLLHEQFK